MKAVIKLSRDSFGKLKQVKFNKLLTPNSDSQEVLWTGIKRYAH
ncbi:MULTISPECIES: hypothetical protein [Corallibacter]